MLYVTNLIMYIHFFRENHMSEVICSANYSYPFLYLSPLITICVVSICKKRGFILSCLDLLLDFYIFIFYNFFTNSLGDYIYVYSTFF